MRVRRGFVRDVFSEGGRTAVFVNDQVDRPCLEVLARLGVKLVSLRSTGFNNVDLAAAKALNLTVSAELPAQLPGSGKR